jgi:hypothetical protein
VRFQLKGSGPVTVFFDENGKDLWQVVVDGKPTQILSLQPGRHDYALEIPMNEGALRPVHSIRLVKRTEAFVGTTHFDGVMTSGSLLKGDLPMSKHHIEVVGDSITCGYGNEGADQNEHFKVDTENAYMSYASVGARGANADVSIIAWSGRKMWPDNTMPDIYDLITPTNPKSVYDFKGPTPEAVVINLATNDFGRGNPDEAKWTGAYESFIRRVWSHYPHAAIYCATGSMMGDGNSANGGPLSTLTGYLQRMISRMNDPRLHFLAFAQQQPSDGYGADWHPSVKTDEIMGQKLSAVLKHDLGW